MISRESPPSRSQPTASSDGLRPYDPRKDPKVIGIAVIVFGTLAIAIAGFGSTPVVGGGDGGGTVFPFQDLEDDARAEVRLSIDANRSSLRPGESVRFTATYENGTPAATASIDVDGTHHALDERGRATVTFEGGGTFTATASKANTETVRYVADATIVSVDRFEIPLAVSANATSVTAGDAVEFSVRRTDTDEPIAGTVTVAGSAHPTDDRGRAVVRIPRAGEFEAVASRDRTATRRYVSDDVAVTVERRQVQLAVDANRSAPKTGETVRLTLSRTDTGEPVEGNLTVGDRSLRTVDGSVSVAYDRAGSYGVRATKPATGAVSFEPAERSLRIHRRVAPAALSANRTVVEPGDAVGFAAVRSDTGEPLAGQLRAGDRTVWLDRRGEATVRFAEPGEIRVAAHRANTSTHRFPADALNVTVEDTEYRIRSVEAPESVARGDAASISAAVENVGRDAGTAEIVYRFDGETAADDSAALDAGETGTVRFDVPTDAEPGTYTQEIAVRDDSVRFDVEIGPTDDSAA